MYACCVSDVYRQLYQSRPRVAFQIGDNIQSKTSIPLSNTSDVSCERIFNPFLVVVLALTHRYNAVRGHRTGSNKSGAEDYLRRKTNEKQKTMHTTTVTNRIPQTEI